MTTRRLKWLFVSLHIILEFFVKGGTNDAPAIETKYVPYGSSLEMGCRMDLEPPIKFHWSKLGGLLPRDVQTFDVRVNSLLSGLRYVVDANIGTSDITEQTEAHQRESRRRRHLHLHGDERS